MKMLLINGSPQGRESCSSLMLDAFTKRIAKSNEIVMQTLSDYNL